MDSRSVYTVSVGEVASDVDTYGETQRALVNFILDFHIDNSYIYRLFRDAPNTGRQVLTHKLETSFEKMCWSSDTRAM